MANLTQRRYRFGPFEVDFAAGELRKYGSRRRLSGQPLQILEMLIERPGQAVSREELRGQLWKDDTFVDFERGLNAAVNRLRDALGDSAINPRYIETLPRMGYRFIAALDEIEPKKALRDVATMSPDFGQPVSQPAGSSEIASLQPEVRKSRGLGTWGRWAYWVPWAVLGVMLSGAAGIYTMRKPANFSFASKDAVLLADFQNLTGEAVFDDALRQGLFVGLEQSPYLQTISDRKSAAVLAQMGRSPAEKLTGPLALELCQRTGGKAVIEGSISTLGASYVIGLTALRCDSGEAVVHEQATAAGKERVIDALDEATAHLRSKLGESIQSIQQYDVPLEQATTPSLEALKTYSKGFTVWDQEGEEAAIPLFQHAVELDPNFAMAYGALAATYENQGETRLAEENAARAYQLRDRVGELERTLIESWHDVYVTGDLERAASITELAVRTYPKSPRVLNDLGSIYGNLGRYDQATDLLRASDQLAPAVATKGNLAISLMALGRTSEAAGMLDEAQRNQLSSDSLLQASYWLAFLAADRAKMQQIVDSSSQSPGAQPLLLCEQSKTEAYYGHLLKSRQLAHESSRLEPPDNREAAASCLAQQALGEAEADDFPAARTTIAEAQKLSHEQSVITLAAMVMARTGNESAALSMARELSRAHPASTFVEKYWTPLIRSEVELAQHHPANALNILSAVEPLDFAAPDELASSTLYPAYVRGQAYLATGDGAKAEQEFKKLIDRPGMVLNFPLGALARLGLARAYSHQGETAKAKTSYEEFLALWKTADKDIPVWIVASKEAKSAGGDHPGIP